MNSLVVLNSKILNSKVLNSKVKKLKTSPEQYEVLVRYIENHPNLKSNKLTNNFTAKDRSRLWEDLTECLNSMRGPQKDVQKWQKTWTDFKHVTLKAARIKRKLLESTGTYNLESFQEELSPLQLRVLNLIGWNETFGNTEEVGNFFKESPPSASEEFFPIVEEHSYSETDEPMYENQEIDDVDDTESNIELFSITKYSDTENYKTEGREENTAINLLLQQQSNILEKFSKQHKRILEAELKEKSKRQKNNNSIDVLLEQQNKLLEKIAVQLERLADAKESRKEEKDNSINILLEQQNMLLERIANQQERIADEEHRKANTLPELSDAIKELLKKK